MQVKWASEDDQAGKCDVLTRRVYSSSKVEGVGCPLLFKRLLILSFSVRRDSDVSEQREVVTNALDPHGETSLRGARLAWYKQAMEW